MANSRPAARLGLALALMFASAASVASDDFICPGDARLATLRGTWVESEFLRQLSHLRSFQAALHKVGDETASVSIDYQDRVYFNLAWHEGDGGHHCVKVSDGKLWARFDDNSDEWLGPYERTEAFDPQAEAKIYLGTFFKGCFRSQIGERWCLSPTSVSIDDKQVPVVLHMDLSEGPDYGTALEWGHGALPFTVFVPRKNGWVIYLDDWGSAEGRVPIDPNTTTPWRTLTR